jgi:thymidylate synthase
MKNWPIYYKDLLTIGNNESNIGVCSLWTPKDKIVSHIDKNSFSLAGQLYSKRGINYIIRNILANPIINKIILCGNDRSGSGETFIKFMQKGIDKEYKVVGDSKCEIHKDINLIYIKKFRKNVELIDLRGETDDNKVKKYVDKFKGSRKLWSKGKVFKETESILADKFPSEKTTFNVRGDYIWESWVQILRLIMKFGSKKGIIKIGEVRELVNLITVIEEEDPYKPEMIDIFDFNKKDLNIYYKDFFSPDKSTESYNYGERIYFYPISLPTCEYNSQKNIFNKNYKSISKSLKKCGLDQLEEVYEKYSRYHEDRGLVICILNPWIDNIKKGWMADKKCTGNHSGNVPCMTLLQFTYRSKKLHLTAYFRSNDMFGAWPRNAFALRKLQFDFAKRIGKKPGFLTTISNCAQIYETNYSQAQKIINKYKDNTFCKPDPRSTLIIETKKDNIIAKHMTPDGDKILGIYKINGRITKAALKFMDKLVLNDVFLYGYNIADIAIEITKAEWCVKNNKRFIQDRDWTELMN